MGDLSPHFSRSELACPHCHICAVIPELVTALEKLRDLGPELIVIHDGYRCDAHNLAVGGVPRSEHCTGEAADLHIVGLDLQQMYDRAKQVPEFAYGGIGVYDTGFIHVDVRPHKARWARVQGKYLAPETLITV